MRKTFLALSILILLTSISIACENTTVSSINANASEFEGKEVCVEGSVSELEFKTSKKGDPYTTFSVNDEYLQSLTVHSLGSLQIKEGDKVKVTGKYDVVKRVGIITYRYYNAIDASSVENLQ
ncbi:MAG: hypothetical protein ACM3SR_06525 [Ignavibacteriales bacterium]